MSKKDTSGGSNLSQNAFGGLNLQGLPDIPLKPAAPAPAAKPAKLQKIHTRIEKSGRSGKTVTVLFGPSVESTDESAREVLLKALKNSLGCGGAVSDATIELQGDVRERVGVILKSMGYPG